ncbi:MAG TPA: endonuclease/exonuclease/phosphatase family protein [Polyangiaceae bacterium]
MTATSLSFFYGCSSSSSGTTSGNDAGDPGDDSGSTDDSGQTIDDGGVPSDGGHDVPDANGPKAHLRIETGNLTTGNNQSYTNGEGARIFEGIKADVILIQEFNVGDDSTTAVRAFVDSVCGTDCYYYREDGANIPNGIISRYRIVTSGFWHDTAVTDRDFSWAQIDIPGPRDLFAISTHLLTSSATNRNIQANEIVTQIQANVHDEYVVLGGDFNTATRDEDCLTTLGAVFDTSGPYPKDGDGNDNTNAPRNKPYDWVVVSPDLRQFQIPVTIGATDYDTGLVVDTRVYSPIEDIAPAMATDSAATNMQHMSVVKDFAVPE